MKHIKASIVRIQDMSPQDIDNFKQWVWRQRDINMFEPVVMKAPRTVMCKSEDEDGPLLYIPLQPVLMYDAIASSPDLTPRQVAMSLWRIGEVVNQTAKATGFQEVCFMCRDDRVSDICARNGFTEVKNVRVLKKLVEITKDEVNVHNDKDKDKS